MRWAALTLQGAPDVAEPASALLAEAGCAGALIEDPAAASSDPFAEPATSFPSQPEGGADAPRPELSAPSPRCRVTGYLPVDDRLEPALESLRAGVRRLRAEGFDVEEEITLRLIDEESWAEAWKAHFRPLRVGRRLVIRPSWETWNAAPGEIVLELDPGMAFGTGMHPSTRLCLSLVSERLRPGERVLDWGTGSGILAIAAARLGAREVLAIDLDPLAVRIAAENAARNGLAPAPAGEPPAADAPTVRTQVASIEALPLEPPFDRIVANLVADPILAGAGEVAARLRPGGEAILGGIVEAREAEVVAGLARAGLRLRSTLAEEEWRALLVERPDA